jgi:hypothetical protein
MPSESVAQRRATAIAKHHPEQLYERNRGLLKMSKSDLRDYARTKESGLPRKKSGLRKAFGRS